jgi:ParB family transcriptional regulator, chromosome partitioning protein
VARRSGLGRGLSALMPTEVTGDRSSALHEVPIASITPNPRQPRVNFDDETMATLAASIKELGVLQPVLVRSLSGTDDEFELIAGERRWRAARRAGLQTIPVLVQTADDANSLEQALVENLHRQDLGVLEEAAAFQQLIDEFDYTHEQVAARVGKSRVAVTNTLRLLQLPAGVQRLLSEGEITAGHARALLGTPDRGFQEDLARSIAVEGLSVRAVEDIVRGRAGVGSPAPDGATPDGSPPRPLTSAAAAGRSAPRLPPAGIVELEGLLSDHLNTRVKVDTSAKRGRLVVEFATLEDLERIYKLMTGAGRAST